MNFLSYVVPLEQILRVTISLKDMNFPRFYRIQIRSPFLHFRFPSFGHSSLPALSEHEREGRRRFLN